MQKKKTNSFRFPIHTESNRMNLKKKCAVNFIKIAQPLPAAAAENQNQKQKKILMKKNTTTTTTRSESNERKKKYRNQI